MGEIKNMILAFIISTAFSSCAGQNKTDTKNKVFKQCSVGEIVTEMAPNTHLIYQDKNQNYWLGNDTKTYKFNGETLLLLSKKDGLISNKIIGIQEDKFGNIYFDTPEGVSKFDGEQFETLKIVEDNSHKNRWKLKQDDLWFRIGWDKKGPYRFDGKNLYHLEFPKSKIEDELYAKYPNISYNPYSIYSMYKDSKGNLWFGTADLGIYQFDGNQIRWMHEEHLGTTPEGGAFGIRSIIEDKDGYFWICNNNYKYKILPDTNKDDNMQLKLLDYRKEKGIINKNEVLYFMSMLVDDNGNLWMINLDGVWRMNGTELVQFFIKNENNEISPSSIYKDNQGYLWFGTQSDGLYKYDGINFEKALFNIENNSH